MRNMSLPTESNENSQYLQNNFLQQLNFYNAMNLDCIGVLPFAFFGSNLFTSFWLFSRQ